MPINVNTTPEQIGVTVGETQIDVAVSGGVGPTGNTGVVDVSAPITNTGTTTAANIGLSVGTGLEVFAGALAVSFGSSAFQVCRGDDARLSNSREWSASTVTQAEAEAGTSTTRRAWTAQRVFQAIAAWWAASSAKTKLDGIATGATANATDAQLRDRSTHTGTQLAATISDFASAVVAAAPPTTNASLLTSGTLPDARLSSNIARTSDVSSAVAAVVNAAPAALDTLNELAAALGNDASFATTVTNALAGKAPIASPTFTGTVGGITATMVGLGNVPNTDATARANHTGTQTASTISDFASAAVSAVTWTTLTGKPTFATVATSGAYSDLTGTPAAYSLPTASGSVLGGVKVGSGLSIDGSGVLTATYSYTLPAATTSTLGGVIVGTGLAVSSGTVSVVTYDVRSDTVSSTSYIGRAVAGSATSASVWTIRRTVLTSAGAVSSTTTATNVKWDDRLTASYS